MVELCNGETHCCQTTTTRSRQQGSPRDNTLHARQVLSAQPHNSDPAIVYCVS